MIIYHYHYGLGGRSSSFIILSITLNPN